MTTPIPDDVVQARLRTVRSQLMTAVSHERTPRYSRARKATIAAIAVGGLVLTGGTIAVVQATQEQIDHQVRCFEAADLGSNYTDVAEAIGIDSTTGRQEARRVLGPETACGDMWRMGLVGQEVAPADPNAANFPVPELVGCTLPNGIGAAFPRENHSTLAEDFCRDLGLTAWTP